MRLFEVDLDAARSILSVLQGLANKPGVEQPGVIPWPTVQNLLKRAALGISTVDGLIALKNDIDPEGDVIQDIKNDGTVILKTKLQNPNDQQKAVPSSSTSVSKMASHNAKNAFK